MTPTMIRYLLTASIAVGPLALAADPQKPGSTSAPPPGATGSSGGQPGGGSGGQSGGGGMMPGMPSMPQGMPQVNMSSADARAEMMNLRFAQIFLTCLAAISMALVVHNLVLYGLRRFRMIVCITDPHQKYWGPPTMWYTLLKRHLLNAPLFRLRHLQEMRLGWRITVVGVIPTRFQFLFLMGMIAMNIVLCVLGIDWHESGSMEMLAQFRNRAGTLAVTNMVPIVMISGKNNPLIRAANISFDTFNMIHRWLGRIAVALGVVHFVAHIIKGVRYSGGWSAFGNSLSHGSKTIISGFIPFLALLAILIQSSTPVRRAAYELFLHIHILLVIIIIAALWQHLEGTPSKFNLQIMIIVWSIERGIRFVRLIHRNLGAGGSTVTVELLPGDAMRITLRAARPWTFLPGQHMYLTIPAVGLWTNHPFSVAWSDEIPDVGAALGSPDASPVSITIDPEKGLPPLPAKHSPCHEPSILARRKSSVSAIVRRRAGFTDKLYRKAVAAQGHYVARALVEGPYGTPSMARDLGSYGTVVLVAGGVGITHQLPAVRYLVSGYANGSVACRCCTLVWSVQSPEHLEWVRPWMTHVLACEGRRSVLRVLLFVTRPRSAREIHSPSATVQMFPGRPNVERLVAMESQEAVGTVCVSVCGPGSLADATRRAARKVEGRAVDFFEESFSW